MKGININCKQIDFVGLILSGKKTLETRRKPTLKPYVGRRIGIVRTGKGRAQLVGYATISEEIKAETETEWNNMREAHCVPGESTFDWKGKAKYLYAVKDVRSIEPIDIFTRGIVSREVPEERKEA